MRRRIAEAIVGVVALILLALGIPLALAVHRSILNSEVVELQAAAARTLAEIRVPIDAAQLAEVPSEPDAPPPFTVYDASGKVVVGDGPATADTATTLRALEGTTVSSTNGQIIVATPIVDLSSESVAGVLRLTESLADVNHRARIAWLIMGASAAGALGLGWLIAERVASRLARPLSDLATTASRLGDGHPIEPTQASGIVEIDTVSNALAASVQRVNDALARERRFSADVSHQLRTPLTALRLRLEAVEAEAGNSNSTALDGAFDDVTRIEQIVEHLLALARDEMPPTSTVRLDVCASDSLTRWNDRVESQGRHITIGADGPLHARGSSASVAQILDVLIDNALRHGEGEIRVTQRRLSGGAALNVSDAGSGLDNTAADRIFRRGEGSGVGIGLALARSLAESDGGRLVLAQHRPTTFSLILLAEEQTPSI